MTVESRADLDGQGLEMVRQTLSAKRLSGRQLRDLWRLRVPVTGEAHGGKPGELPIPWMQGGEDLAQAFVKHALQTGAFWLACDGARETIELYQESTELRTKLAIALLRLGSAAEARLLLEEAASQGTVDALTLSLIGDCFYYEGVQAGADELRRGELRSALKEYQSASALEPGDFRLVTRTASVAALLGGYRYGQDPVAAAQAKALALRALELIQKSERGTASPNLLLEKANALCVLDCVEDAKAMWQQASQHEHASAHVLARARAHARLLATAGGRAEEFFDSCFPPLRLVVFSGHMMDNPKGSTERFPAEAEQEIRQLIAAAIAELSPCAGFSGAAAGSDLLFLEELEAFRPQAPLGLESHVVLPWAREAFRESSVRPCGDPWLPRFDRALELVDSVRILGEAQLPEDTVGLDYANQVISGLALNLAQVQGLDLVPLVVWNGERGRAGGTESFVNFWKQRGYEATNVLDEAGQARFRTRTKPGIEKVIPQQPAVSQPPVPGGVLGRRTSRPPPSGFGKATLGREVKTMLFADVVGYSKLSEAVVPNYIEHFMGLTSRLMADSIFAPISVNTWGDALYMVFGSAEAAGMFALDLVSRINCTNWIERGVFWLDAQGVKHPISMRTALHTGPVYVHNNPIVRALGYTGSHVSRAARIEPITPHARIYASEEFAAMAEVEAVIDFVCHFVGTLPLAKKYPGEFALYDVREVRHFPVEPVARAVHERYRSQEAKKGNTVETNASMCSWESLPPHLQQENRNQAAGIKDQVYRLGYELVPSARGVGVNLQISKEDVETLARREHERWMESKRSAGWVYGPVRDNERRIHPSLVEWEKLSESEKEKDRDTVRNIPELLELAGFGVVGVSRNTEPFRAPSVRPSAE